MELHVASDLHLELYKPGARDRVVERLLPAKGEVLVLAGDIVNLQIYDVVKRDLTAFWERYEKVFYVPGNHEYWRRSREMCHGILMNLELEQPNFHWLRSGTVVEYKGKRFLGDTMWFPDHPYNAIFAPDFIDFEIIPDFVPWVYQQNMDFWDFLKKELKEDDIVITHHAPSHLSVHPRYISDPYNRFYMSSMEHHIIDKKPALWIHGHMHDPIDYMIDRTRIYSNPFGYMSEHYKGKDKKFKERLSIEI